MQGDRIVLIHHGGFRELRGNFRFRRPEHDPRLPLPLRLRLP